MWQLWVSGGFPMIFVLVFGLFAIGASVAQATRPVPGRGDAIVSYGVAVALVSVAGMLFDLTVVLRAVAEWPDEAERGSALLVGIAESMSPVILGFSLVAVAALVAALGVRRVPLA